MFFCLDCDLDVIFDVEKLCGFFGLFILVYFVLNEIFILDFELVFVDFWYCREVFFEVCNRGGSFLRWSVSMGCVYD